MKATEARTKLNALASPEVAVSSARFFESRPGQFGEGDPFIGVRVPTLRKLARERFSYRKNVEGKKLFGCLCFFINGNALAGDWKDRLIARLDPDEVEAVPSELHVRAFDITRWPMRNWVAVEPEGVENDTQLMGWIERVTTFVSMLPKK